MAQGTYPLNTAQRNPGLMSVVYFTASGTFNKADYPGAQSVRVRVQGAGGGGGGTYSTSGGAGGGGAGSYAESLLDIGELATSETVTVGTGGSGGTAFSNGSSGGNSSFGSHVIAEGGTAGQTVGGSGISGGQRRNSAGSTGDIVIPGAAGEHGVENSANGPGGGNGGNSVLGTGGRGFWVSSGSFSGTSGVQGGGSGGAFSAGSTNTSTNDGGDGIVIVEVYSTYKGGDTDQFATRQYADEITSAVRADKVNANESTGSTSYVNLTTPGPSVVVNSPRDQRVLIMFGATVYNSGLGLAVVSYEVTGATTVAASDDNSLSFESSNTGDISSISGFDVVDLNAGANTISLKYRITASGNTGNFLRRKIAAFPLESA